MLGSGRRIATLIVAIAIAGGGAHAATPPDPFYLDLLETGARRLATGAPERAAQDLRLACFGLLDDPAVLARGLVLLTAASGEAADRAVVLDTFRRLVEVEERFDVVRDLRLSADESRRFSAALDTYLPRQKVEAIASLAAFLPAVQPPPPETRRGRRARAKQDSAPPEKAASAAVGEDRSVAATPVPEPVGVVTDPPSAASSGTWEDLVASTPTTAEREILEVAEQGLVGAIDRAELERHFESVARVLAAHPEMPDAHLLAAQLAYRASLWEVAVMHFRESRSLVDRSASMQFYFAVSLFEIGEQAEAADILREALPELEPSSFVERYRKRILD